MPEIGRPAQDNPFQGIQRAPRSETGSMRESSNSVGDELNRIAGRVPESRYKSYEEHTQLDKNGFLKLLAHQLQNQNPLEPMDQKDFSSNLAQFSQLEQLTNMNSNLEKFGKNAGHEEKFYGASFLGREVYTDGSTINHSGRGAMIPFVLERPADRVILRLVDDRQQIIAQVEREGVSEGAHNFRWDGISMDGTRASEGTFRVEVSAWDSSGAHFSGQTQAQGLVTGVQFNNGETILIVDGERRVSLRDVNHISKSEHPDNSAQMRPTPSTEEITIKQESKLDPAIKQDQVSEQPGRDAVNTAPLPSNQKNNYNTRMYNQGIRSF